MDSIENMGQAVERTVGSAASAGSLGAGVWISWIVVLVSLFSIWVIGFAPMHTIHDAFHDVRHATGFPCH